jgi:hypothetical protein
VPQFTSKRKNIVAETEAPKKINFELKGTPIVSRKRLGSESKTTTYSTSKSELQDYARSKLEAVEEKHEPCTISSCLVIRVSAILIALPTLIYSFALLDWLCVLACDKGQYDPFQS